AWELDCISFAIPKELAMPRFSLLVGAAIVLAGCESAFPHPMRAEDLSRFPSGDALVAYLAQRGASPAVCDLRATGPHLSHYDADVRDALVQGLIDGRIEPRVWRQCLGAALPDLSPESAALLLDAVGRGYRSLLRRDELEKSTALQTRLAAMQSLYLERPI